MKKALMLLALLGSPVLATTDGTVNLSSFTKTNDAAGCIQARELDKVIVGGASAGGSIALFNSTWTVAGPQISTITLGTVQMYDFNDTKVSGICYTTVLNTNGVTILFKK